jgi:hypothetical protein
MQRVGFLLLTAFLAPQCLGKERVVIRPASAIVDPAVHGIPLEFRVSSGGKEAIVVTAKSGPKISLVDLTEGTAEQVKIEVPEGVSQFTPAGADFIGDKEFVVSASWVESSVSRSGLTIINRDGKIRAMQGYGISVRSVAVARGGERIAASIQEPQDPLSESPDRPSGNLLALFDQNGKLLERYQTACSPLNAFKSFAEMHKSHARRKVNLLRDDVILSIPGPSRWSYPAACILAASNLRGKPSAAGGASPPKVASSGLALHLPLFKPPIVEGVADGRTLRALNVLPFYRGTVPMYLVIWLAGGEGAPKRDVPEGGPYRDAGKVIFAAYSDVARPDDPAEWVAELEEDLRIAEVASTQDGKLYALTYEKITEGWRVSELTLKND